MQEREREETGAQKELVCKGRGAQWNESAKVSRYVQKKSSKVQSRRISAIL